MRCAQAGRADRPPYPASSLTGPATRCATLPVRPSGAPAPWADLQCLLVSLLDHTCFGKVAGAAAMPRPHDDRDRDYRDVPFCAAADHPPERPARRSALATDRRTGAKAGAEKDAAAVAIKAAAASANAPAPARGEPLTASARFTADPTLKGCGRRNSPKVALARKRRGIAFRW